MDVVRELKGSRFPVLVPNLKVSSGYLMMNQNLYTYFLISMVRLDVFQGLEAAIVSGAQEVAIFVSASETFSKKNINCGIEESFKRFEEVMDAAKKYSLPVRGYLLLAYNLIFYLFVWTEPIVSIVFMKSPFNCLTLQSN